KAGTNAPAASSLPKAHERELTKRIAFSAANRDLRRLIRLPQGHLFFLPLLHLHRQPADHFLLKGARLAFRSHRLAVNLDFIRPGREVVERETPAVTGQGRLVEPVGSAQLNGTKLPKHIRINSPDNASRSRRLDRQIGALFRRQFFEMIDSAVGHSLAPVNQLDLAAVRHALEEELAVGGSGMALELKYIGRLLDLASLDHLPVERKLVASPHAIVGSRRAARPRTITGDNQSQLDAANRLTSVIDQLAAHLQELT